jgi:integrase
MSVHGCIGHGHERDHARSEPRACGRARRGQGFARRLAACFGAPARAIQELAGHQDLGTTQRYVHLSPAALDAAIRLLDSGGEGTRAAVER